MIAKIAGSKWFVPTVLLIMLITVIASFAVKSSGEGDEPETLEEQIEELCNSVCGVDNTKVMVTYADVQASTFFGEEKNSEIVGIAILCKDGDNPEVQLKLYRILHSLFGVPSNRIAISERK